MTDKFKNKLGAPKKPLDQVRPNLSTRISPATKSWLDSERKRIGSAYGVSIDKLVKDKMDKDDYDSEG